MFVLVETGGLGGDHENLKTNSKLGHKRDPV